MKRGKRKGGRRKLLAGAVLLFVLAASSLATAYGYFQQDTNQLENTLSVGNVTTHIEEDFSKTDDTHFEKNPCVVNTGINACLVRMRVNVSPAGQKDNLLFGLDEENWTYRDEDGFYYYRGIVQPGERTTALFTTVEVKDAEMLSDFDIVLYQEAVQGEMVVEGQNIKGDTEEGRLLIWEAYDKGKPVFSRQAK